MINCFKPGYQYIWIGSSKISEKIKQMREFNLEYMSFILDGKPHTCNTNSNNYNASFKDCKDSSREWDWSFFINFIEEYNTKENEIKISKENKTLEKDFTTYLNDKQISMNKSTKTYIKEFEHKRKKLKSYLSKKDIKEKLKNEIDKEILKLDDEIELMKYKLSKDNTKEIVKKIKRHKKIKNIIYQNNHTIKIYTTPIIMKDINIGGYNIIINFRSNYINIYRNRGVIKAEDSRAGWVNHPFITSDGIPCFGRWNKTISEALNYGGLLIIINSSIKLLECTSVDNTGSYTPISKFLKEIKKLTN